MSPKSTSVQGPQCRGSVIVFCVTCWKRRVSTVNTMRENPGLVPLATGPHVPSSVRNNGHTDRAVIAARTSHGATPRLS